MSLLQNSNAISEGGGYNLENSLRFRSSASAYLSRTPATAGNRKTWTWSGWVKRGTLGGSSQILMGAAITAGSTEEQLLFGLPNTDGLAYRDGVTGNFTVLPSVLRDPSAWYHIIFAYDSANATQADRGIFYINGVRQTATTNAVPLNRNSFINNTSVQAIGRYGFIASNYFDGYLTEINFVDGQALTPSDFGETNEDTGVWQPAKYTGTYGTNGFYLKGRGTDNSGNGNNWTENNFNTATSTATTYDIMTDVPTLTDEDTANYAVINPLAFPAGTTGLSSSNGNLTYTNTNGANAYPSYATFYAPSGKFYFEATITARGGASDYGYIGANNVYYANTGKKQSLAAYGSSWTTGDIIGVAIDNGVGVTFYKNNVSQGLIATTEIHFPRWAGFNGTIYDINFGQRPFAYTPPAGYLKLNTFNLPDSSIVDGSENFNTVLYTGNGGTQSITGVNFQPDWLWLKSRSNVANHGLFDVNRVIGVPAILSSNSTAVENTGGTYISSFDSDGFSVNANTSGNGSGQTYVAWNWKAGGTAVSNTDGTITSSVSANPTAGFSVVSHTSTGTTGTVGHGLGVAPKLIIEKTRNLVEGWLVQTSVIDGTHDYLWLDTTAAKGNMPWGSLPTSTVFSSYGHTIGTTKIAYCFAEVEGYSKIGSYTGNGSTDGPFIYTGFRPKFVLFKRTDTVAQWIIEDTARSTYNVIDARLFTDSTEAELSNGNGNIDYLSNGFKLRNSHTTSNVSGGTYIYMAFAESPFKVSLAR